jgi:GDPmannose 4,6-dehydratase
MKTLVLTGASGNMGRCLIDYLQHYEKDIEIVAVVRRKTDILPEYLLFSNIDYTYSDLLNNDAGRIIEEFKPDYFVNFAAYTYPFASWESPANVYNINTLSVLDTLEAIRRYKPDCRFFQAGTSEQYSKSQTIVSDIDTSFCPDNPYGSSKAAAHELVRLYRNKYRLYAVNAILFNNESEYKSENFVTRKITSGMARIKKELESTGKCNPIRLGYLGAKRPWGDARDFVDAVWRMLNQERFNLNFKDIKDYIVCSNQLHTVKNFVDYSAICAGLGIEWNDESQYSFAFAPPTRVNRQITITDMNLYRYEDRVLIGDSSAIRAELGWNPKTNLLQLIDRMVKYDLLNR